MSRDWLNVDQSSEELDELYGERDYYAYLRSHNFRPLYATVAAHVSKLVGGDGYVLDVGCGEAMLADYLPSDIRYFGLDASRAAIRRARERMGLLPPVSNLYPHRIEERFRVTNFGVVVFGAIMEVLIKPKHRVDLVNQYRETTRASHFIVHDLDRLDVSELSRSHHLLSIQSVSLSAQGLPHDFPPAKLKRQVWVFEYRS